MTSEVGVLESEVKEYKTQLETVQLGLNNDLENEELQNLKTELEEVIALTEATIAELKPAAASPPPKSTARPVKEKWSKENHPAYQAGYRGPESEQPAEDGQTTVSLKVNDQVSARWKTGDGSWYPARITAITGSTNKPVYIVTFQKYATTETLSAKDIRALAPDSRKRKADGVPPSAISPITSNPNVISAAASVDPTLASQARQEPSKVGDGPARPTKVARKVKASKELESGKNKWQEFASKGKSSKAKKESMFRTPDGVNARVGFTGSGQEMRKDPTRSRHIYSANNDDEQ